MARGGRGGGRGHSHSHHHHHRHHYGGGGAYRGGRGRGQGMVLKAPAMIELELYAGGKLHFQGDPNKFPLFISKIQDNFRNGANTAMNGGGMGMPMPMPMGMGIPMGMGTPMGTPMDMNQMDMNTTLDPMNPGMPMGMGMMPMGMGMMPMGMGMMPGMTPGMMTQQMQNMIGPQNPAIMTGATIYFNGTETSPADECGHLCTVIWGALLIFPLFLLCCDCYKKRVMNHVEVSVQYYRSLQLLIGMSSVLQELDFSVADNQFNAEKANILLGIVSRSTIKTFNFKNSAGPFGGAKNPSAYSDFERNMAPFQNLRINVNMNWADYIVTSIATANQGPVM